MVAAPPLFRSLWQKSGVIPLYGGVARSDGVVGIFDVFLSMSRWHNNPLKQTGRGREPEPGTTPPFGHPSVEGNFIGRLFNNFPKIGEKLGPLPRPSATLSQGLPRESGSGEGSVKVVRSLSERSGGPSRLLAQTARSGKEVVRYRRSGGPTRYSGESCSFFARHGSAALGDRNPDRDHFPSDKAVRGGNGRPYARAVENRIASKDRIWINVNPIKIDPITHAAAVA